MSTLVELIALKRDGRELSDGDIRRLIEAHGQGEMADYQMTALLMAIFFRGMTDRETWSLTQAMLTSGTVLSLATVKGFKVDKHSTGGVGDKVSLCLAPLVAACGVPVPMISGRGLGHTGGTLDKLEAIPGFRVDLDAPSFERVVREVGVSMIGQTSEIAPADKRLYALRDVTATVESIPLIVASILSKKLAEGIDGLVLDVKVGAGAFMRDRSSARKLALRLVDVGRRGGKKVVALLTDMSAPLGRMVGNALETREAIDVLSGGGPNDVRACTLALGVEMLTMAGRARGRAQAEKLLRDAIASGAGLGTMEQMIRAQGGDPDVVRRPELLPKAALRIELVAPRAGYVGAIDPREIGLVAVALGAGRTRADQSVDPAVGIELLAVRGDRVKKGAPLARLHVRDRDEKLCERTLAAFHITAHRPRSVPLVLERIVARTRPSGSRD